MTNKNFLDDMIKLNEEMELYEDDYNPLISDEEYHINYLLYLDDLYFNTGHPLISDEEYDTIKEIVRTKFPNNIYFQTIGAPVRTGKEKLPYSMGGLKQLKTNTDLQNRLKSHPFGKNLLISEKLDGYSVLLHFFNGKLVKGFSRGNDFEGANVVRHLVKISSIPKNISLDNNIYIRGEITIDPNIFKEKYSLEYANARNFVSGKMNATITANNILNNLTFTAHEFVNNEKLSKKESYDLLAKLGFNIPYYEFFEYNLDILTEENLFSIINRYKSRAIHEIDGIVVTINELQEVEKVSKSLTSVEPEHSFKFKLKLDKIATSKVTNIYWEASKNGLIKPTIEIEPVLLAGSTISNITGCNLRYIVNNGLGPGAIIILKKAGSIIPQLVDVLESVEPQYPNEFDWEWNTNDKGEHVEAILKNITPEVIFKQVLDFFTSLEVELLKEANLKLILDTFDMINDTYDNIINTIFDLTEKELEDIIGINGNKIYKSLHRRLQNLTLPIICGSLNSCGAGIGIRRFTALFEQVSWDKLNTLSIEQIAELKGFDTKTAQQIFNGLPKIREFLERHKDIIKFKQEEIKTVELNSFNVVFTEVRDNELEKKILSMGGKVGSSVSKKTTHLITASLYGTSGKMLKAREFNIPILTLEGFKDKYNL